ncbi:MAG: hypothetical protein A2176_08740 [Spirochaetes bacterium RBG_13_51_14]|nr:MAG: hypothetical protein A2176_08740 [Spirochaetes bacterium RBG_13_51_14]
MISRPVQDIISAFLYQLFFFFNVRPARHAAKLLLIYIQSISKLSFITVIGLFVEALDDG